ncbi:hypothetical protein AMS68_005770 [Peltaster fructicola]|uniref:DhaL domain-containing protein n=1 Tax=Peltaster fructicola TaxID=286661 RepID=A0A6H0XZR5_9PEZI|nr:hypothetical protein AMS68_005770 [Peltaster fructicola]
MSIVVEPTVPYSSAVLDLDNPHRWNSLFPLIRASVIPVQTCNGQTILVDQTKASSRDVHVAVVGRLGHFPSKLLDNKDVTAVVNQQQYTGVLTAQDITRAIKQSGVDIAQGVVVLHSGSQQRVHSQGSDVLDVETNGEFELNHLLCLIGSATTTCRQSIYQVADLIKLFHRNVSTTRSLFGIAKINGDPALLHTDGARAFEQAKHAIEKDLTHIFASQSVQQDPTVYSVHYSDLNGLSRLENYILAAELGQLLEARGLTYKLSHSTVLDREELARGYSISVCPVPARYLDAQPKADIHNRSPQAANHAQSQATSTVMSFSDAQAKRCIQAGCNAVIKAEPTITKYDTIVGDGDCGYTLRDGARQVLQFIEDKDLSRLPVAVNGLVHNLEVNMGGTSGALYCIYLTALASSLSTESTIAKALQDALKELSKYTKARVGDRTMMDTLIPFTETFAATGSLRAALTKARAGVESTKALQAQLGRSSYLEESITQGVPDPGAYGLLVLLEGMSLLEH